MMDLAGKVAIVTGGAGNLGSACAREMAMQGARVVVSVLAEVTGAAGQTRQSAEHVLIASQAVETAAAELRLEVEGFLSRVAA